MTDPDVDKIPHISIKDNFEVTIYDDASGATTDKTILMTDKLMRRADTDAVLIKYKVINNLKLYTFLRKLITVKFIEISLNSLKLLQI